MRALPPGAVKRRTFFGLLDADGWAAAIIKALFWFLLILFLLGYVPDRAYYFTVSRTIDVGYNAVPIVNLCPTTNQTLPCPAPLGAVVPWQPSPAELALPEPRIDSATFQSGTNLYLIGGSTAGGATAETLMTEVTTDGNYRPWAAGPALPAPRTNAALASLSGVPYVIGGLDESGAPTTTVFQGVVTEGQLTGWEQPEAIQLPVPVSHAGAAPTGNGIYLIGGRTAEGLTDSVYLAAFGEADPPTLEGWQETRLPLPQPRADVAAVPVGDMIYVIGGEGPEGISRSVFRLMLDEGQPLTDPATGDLLGWAEAPEGQQLPVPRARASASTANGVLYVIGGVDGDGEPQASTGWTVPTPTGDLPRWERLDQSDLLVPRAGSALANVGSFAFLIGGEGPDGPVDASLRANTSPETPFFALGLFGATIPGMAIEGEIGQQLGYMAAAGVGTGNFVALILIGLAFSHRQGTARVIERLSRGRIRAPREDEYTIQTGTR